ncbi:MULTISPECIES: hypothetical protein [unclassified Enterococcus]|uniref:hypothetical protein n=1 Tax=unclassified Enterococcus TaxID=2608891 RepID=UPI001CE1D818|nr:MULTISPECIES: hypothetical protein [unclassified Enterococcus]MCA5013633.1 hypothetical protein [Enterococcus sp. S23]MCA5016883.1 hypothetical protein [Enterococcus sp. S22(2020)]
MKKVFLTSLISGIFLLSLGAVSANAEEIVSDIDSAVTEKILPDPDAPITSDEGASYLDIPEINLDESLVEQPTTNTRLIVAKWWSIESKTSAGNTYGPWRNGPSGKGKATLSATNSNTSNRSVSASISGDYPIGKGKIGSSVGVTIGESKTYGVSYSRVIPAGKKEQIIFRPVYKMTKVKQRQYVAGAKTNTVKTATVKSFSHWEYSFKSI